MPRKGREPKKLTHAQWNHIARKFQDLSSIVTKAVAKERARRGEEVPRGFRIIERQYKGGKILELASPITHVSSGFGFCIDILLMKVVNHGKCPVQAEPPDYSAEASAIWINFLSFLSRETLFELEKKIHYAHF
jgi:hypothetical protein